MAKATVIESLEAAEAAAAVEKGKGSHNGGMWLPAALQLRRLVVVLALAVVLLPELAPLDRWRFALRRARVGWLVWTSSSSYLTFSSVLSGSRSFRWCCSLPPPPFQPKGPRRSRRRFLCLPSPNCLRARDFHRCRHSRRCHVRGGLRRCGFLCRQHHSPQDCPCFDCCRRRPRRDWMRCCRRRCRPRRRLQGPGTLPPLAAVGCTPGSRLSRLLLAAGLYLFSQRTKHRAHPWKRSEGEERERELQEEVGGR